MFWKIKEKKTKAPKYIPQPADQRIVKKFAWFPKYISEPSKHKVWLQNYYSTQELNYSFWNYDTYAWNEIWTSLHHPNDWEVILEHSEPSGWVGFDLDGTLALHVRGNKNMDYIGSPIVKMVRKVKNLLQRGWEVKIVTARAADATPAQLQSIRNWCCNHIGKELPIVAAKDGKMVVLYDDRALRVESNTGKVL